MAFMSRCSSGAPSPLSLYTFDPKDRCNRFLSPESHSVSVLSSETHAADTAIGALTRAGGFQQHRRLLLRVSDDLSLGEKVRKIDDVRIHMIAKELIRRDGELGSFKT